MQCTHGGVGNRVPEAGADQGTTWTMGIGPLFGDLTHESTSCGPKSSPKATFLRVQTTWERLDLDGVFGRVFQSVGRMNVDLCRGDILVTECVAYLFYRSAVLEGHGGKGMPQGVR